MVFVFGILRTIFKKKEGWAGQGKSGVATLSALVSDYSLTQYPATE